MFYKQTRSMLYILVILEETESSRQPGERQRQIFPAAITAWARSQAGFLFQVLQRLQRDAILTLLASG